MAEGESVEESKKKPAQQPMQPPKIAPELDRLRSWAGSWNTSERYEQSEMMAEGGSATGKAECHIGPGGIVVEEYASTGGPMGGFDGHLVITWDGKNYVAFWFDSFDSKGMISRGTWEGDRLVLLGKSPKRKWRMTYIVRGETREMISETAAQDGDAFKKAFSIVYEKAPDRTTH